MTCTELIAHLENYQRSNGASAEVCFANYLEETVVSTVTNYMIVNGKLVLLHDDGGELTALADSYTASAVV